jgi:RHS repeat-associated protein
MEPSRVANQSASYYRARYYDPSIGRFDAEDKIGWFGKDVNFYCYASNRPSMFIDPLGRKVYICHRAVQFVGFFGFLNDLPSRVTHTWVKRDPREAGLGPANGTLPGQNAPPAKSNRMEDLLPLMPTCTQALLSIQPGYERY